MTAVAITVEANPGRTMRGSSATAQIKPWPDKSLQGSSAPAPSLVLELEELATWHRFPIVRKLCGRDRIPRSEGWEMSTTSSPNVAIAQKEIGDVIAAMARLPDDYAPPEDSPRDPELPDAGLCTPEMLESLRTTYEAWPEGILLGFHRTSEMLAQILMMFGARPYTGGINPLDLAPAGIVNPAEIQLAFQSASERQLMGAQTPFPATVSTLLGPFALTFLFKPNSIGQLYLQPHEFSRAGWIGLTRIRDQIEIERELARFGAEHAAHAKIVVCLLWTLAALTSLMEPRVFLTERIPMLSSLRSQGTTLSVGAVSTIVNFSPLSMRNALQVLREGLTHELMTACDLMWIAAGVVRRRSVEAGFGKARPRRREQFEVFLSHRGCDAKNTLAQTLLRQHDASGVFLDCLRLPRSVINRNFVFGAIGRSANVVVVDTPNFAKSEWCMKELWVAQQLERLGLTTLRRCSLSDAVGAVSEMESIQAKDGTDTPDEDTERAYPILSRILTDIRYWARAPNLDSLAKLGPIPDELQHAEDSAAAGGGLATTAEASAAAREAVAVLEAATHASPRGKPIDLWASATQLAVALLGSNIKARSKMEVRASIDSMNRALERMAAQHVFAGAAFRKRGSGYLACLAGAVVSELAGFRLDPFTSQAIREAVGDAAILRDGVLLLDVRGDRSRRFRLGAWRERRRRKSELRFVLALLSNGLSAVGIVQNADDHVHELMFDGQSLEVLPCVTLHAGMESLFPELL